jgi:hypothetical protein
MPGVMDRTERDGGTPPYRSIARRIGLRLRDVYEQPEAGPLPTEHVDLLLKLRHKERDRSRRGR